MGLRLFLLLAALWALYLLLRRAASRRISEKKNRPRPAVDTVSCAHCGIHIPENEALTKGDLHFCCREHMRLEKRKN